MNSINNLMNHINAKRFLFFLLFTLFLSMTCAVKAATIALKASSYAQGYFDDTYATLVTYNPNLVTTEIKSGTSRTDPHLVYIPFKINADDEKYNLQDHLFVFNEKVRVVLAFTATGMTSGEYFHVAVKNDGDDYLISSATTAVANETNFSFSLENLRTNEVSDSSSQLDFDADNDSIIVYIFTGPQNPITATAGHVNPTTDTSFAGGLYVKLMFSQKHDSTNYPVISRLRRGDESLVIDYGVGSVDTTIYSTDSSIFRYPLTYSIPGSVTPADDYGTYQELKAAYPSATIQSPSNEPLGLTKIKKLSNGETYSVAVALVNKYGFVSKSSAFQTGSPQEIEAFIETKGCYLLSAGFQQESFVLEYFRNFRDHFLAATPMGRAFITWYYDQAPYFTHYIYESPAMSFIVRSLAYTLFAVMNIIYYGMILALCLLPVFIGITLMKRGNDLNP